MYNHGQKSENSYPKTNIYIIVFSLVICIFEVWHMKGIFLRFVFSEEPGPTCATHAVCKIESVAWRCSFMGRLKFQGQMSQKKHISREVNYS